MHVIDKVIEELHEWSVRYEGRPKRVIVHDVMFRMMVKERREVQPPLFHRDENENWVIRGIPVFCTEQIELGAVLIE